MKTGLIKVASNSIGLGSLTVVYEGSALREYEGVRGISHLSEHLICKAFDHMLDKFQESGITYNAYTANDHIGFYWTGLNRKIEEYQSEMLKIITYIPNKEDFEKEKKIVLQEYDDYTSQQSFIYANIYRKYSNYYGPIGFRKDIENINYEEFLSFFMKQFIYPTSIIRIGDSSSIDELAKDFQYAKPLPKPSFVLSNIGVDDDVVSSASFENSLMCVDYVDCTGFDKRVINIINAILSHGLNSPLYKEIRENRGLVYGLGMYHEIFSEDVSVSLFSYNTSNEKKDEVRQVFKNIMENIEYNITKERFDVIIEREKCNFEINNALNYNKTNEYKSYDYEYINLDFLTALTYEEVINVSKEYGSRFVNNIRYAEYGKTCIV